MTTTTVSPNGEVAIPKAVLESLNLEPGTEISIEVRGSALVLKRISGDYPDWRTMEGMARGGESLTKALMEERAAELAHDDARIQGR